MPRELKEVRNFNQGTMLNVSERDIPDNAAAFSLNVNPLSEHGILSAIKNDKLFAASTNSYSTISTPISWGNPGYHHVQDIGQLPNDDGYQYVQVDNIGIAQERAEIDLKFIGTKGKTERLVASNIRPWMEKQFITYNTIDVMYEVSNNVAKYATELPILTETNAITRGTITSDSVYTIEGFTHGSAKIVAIHATASQYDTGTLVITTPDNHVETYIFDDDDDGATGTEDGSGNVRIQLDSISGQGNIAAQIKAAIESANGHDERISITVSTTTASNDTLTLEYVHRSLDSYLFPGDYIALVSQTGSGLAHWHEIIKIEDVDVSAGNLIVKRGCFGSRIKTINSGGEAYIYSNKITIDQKQQSTKKGYFNLHIAVDEEDRDFHTQDRYEWSKWSGNHIGGNSSFLHRASNVLTEAKHGGAVTTSTSNHGMEFNATNKTLTMGSAVDILPFYEGDYVTFYHNNDDGANNGFSAKILQKTEASTGCVLTFDTAPTQDTETSNVVYMEANLLQNHTFHHQVDQTAPAQTISDTTEYKINHWAHSCYREESSGYIQNEYGYGAQQTDANILQVDTGGFWTTSNGFSPQDGASDPGIPFDGAIDQDAKFYPFTGADKYMRMTSEFVQTGYSSTAINISSDMYVGQDEAHFNQHENLQPSMFLAKGDVVKLTNNVTWEYMRVRRIEGGTAHMERGIWGTTELAIDADNAEQKKVWKRVNHGLQQKVSKDKLKPNQQYVLSFYAQDEDSNFTVGSCSTVNTDATITLNAAITSPLNPIVPGMLVTGTGITDGTTVASVTDTTHFELSAPATATASGSITLTFYNPGQGCLSLRVNGGHIDESGSFQQFSKSIDKGHITKAFGNVTTEERWIYFTDIGKENNDSAVDVFGAAKDNGLDGQWRKFSFVFKTPNKLLTDLTVDFASMGPDGSIVSIDLADLRENTILINSSQNSSMGVTSLLDNGGVKDLIFWDSIQNKLGYMTNVFKEMFEVKDFSYSIVSSPYTSSDLTSFKQTFVPNNREVHVGLGSSADDSNPQWLGYVNHRVFGQDYSKQIYQDEDTVHQYGMDSAGTLSKICVAGEHEGLTGVTSSSGTILTITHTAHSMNNGDNIVVREWGDVSHTWKGSGVWVVVDASGANAVVCMRHTPSDATPADATFLNTTGARDTNTGRVCYRPYYYYGVRDGDYHIYRITPSAKIDDASTSSVEANLNTTYVAGKIERSMPLRTPLNSICTCHSKKDEATAGQGGGKIYVSSSVSNDIYVLDVQVKHNEWTTTELPDSIIHPIYKSFKWSNDNIDGDVGGEEVFPGAGKAEDSSPTITPSGILSDIMETKGPNALYVHAATSNNDNDPDHFDTRLWIQFRPAGEDTFGEGARFLFCGITNKDNSGTGTEASITFGDRTPPMNVLFGSRWDIGSTPYDWAFWFPIIGRRGNAGSYFDYGDFTANSDYTVPDDWNKYAMYYGWINYDNADEYGSRYMQRIMTQIDGQTGYSNFEDYNTYIQPYNTDYPYYQFGHNIGWWGIGGNWPSVKVAKYGLCPMADNDNDGVIDGTGIVVPSTTSITSNENPYGNLHQRVSAHCVGIIGGSERPWWRHGGKLQNSASAGFWVGGHQVSSGWDAGSRADTPENVGMDKCLFICSDMHYGDFQPPQEIDYTVTEGESINGRNLTQFTLGTTTDGVNQSKFLQAGDCVYIKDSTGTNYDTAATVMGVDNSNNKVTVDIIYSAGTATGIIYTHTPKPGGWKGGNTGSSIHHRNFNHGVAKDRQQVYHYSFDKTDPNNGDIFTKGAACGHYGRTWYSKPNVPTGRFSFMPGILQKTERLDYRAGFMMRPFEATVDTFEDLIVGNNTAIDIPGMPDAVYHVKNDVVSPNYLHKHVNDDAVNNQFASRMYISSPASLSDEDNKTKIYICDLNLNFPHQGNHIPSQQLHEPGNGDTGTDFDSMDNWDIIARGTLKGTPYTSVSTNDAWLTGATNNPVVTFTDGVDNVGFGKQFFKSRGYTGGTNTNDDGPLGHRNGFAGLCLSIVDRITGTVQTRYIVSSHTAGTADDDHAYVGVHYPFGHTPIADDRWYISHHSNICTAPIRLLKEVNLLHGVGDALDGDPTLGAPIFKNTGDISDLDSSGTTATATTSDFHNLTTSDEIEISSASDADYNGIYAITVTSPKIFTFTTAGSGLTADSTATWTLIRNKDSSASNPIKVNISAPTFKTMFGGLDMRKSKSLVTTDDDIQGSAVTAELAVHSTGHLLQTGDVVTINANTAAHDGTYIINDKTTDDFDVINSSTANDTTDAQPITINQWEALVAERGSNARIGELRSGFNSWDKGNIQNNILRYDTSVDNLSFMSVSEAGITVKASSIGGQTGDFFTANTIYSYKVSFIYDGYQEGPLSESSWNFEDSLTRAKLGINIKISKYSNRLSHVCVYRRDTASDFYKLVEQISTSGGWAYDGFSHVRQVEDDGIVGASYSARTGMSEVLDTIRLKYGISAEIDGYLFAGDCAHSRIENASNMVFRSRPGMFSIFDYANDFLTLKSKPTALANFNGRLYIFDDNNIYKVNQQTLAIEDIFEGIGCLNKDAVIVTEYGMFFADKSGAYMHNGNMPVKISEAIQQGGGTTTSFAVTSSDHSAEINDSGTTDNIKDVSWESIVTNEDISKLQVTFLPRTSSVLFTVNYTGYTDLKGLSLSSAAFNDSFKIPKTFQYIWSYNISQKRWDLWELSEDSIIGKPFLGKSGELYVPVDESVYEYSGGSSDRDFTWLSKRLSMDEDSVGKVFNKIKVNGLSTNLNGTGIFNESSQRLIVTTSTGTLTAANTTYSSESSDHSTYRFSGANRKGRWIQFKLEDMTEPVDSVGVLFRRKGPK